MAPFPGIARALPQSFAADQRGFIMGGSDASNNVLKDVWEYNPFQNQWYQKNDLPFGGRYGGSTFVVGNRPFLGMGNNGSVQRDLWEYTPTPLSFLSFQKSYGRSNDDTDTDSLSSRVCYGSTTVDGGYIIVSTTQSFNASKDIYLIKTNAYGDTLWTKTYGTSTTDEVACSVKQTSDGGYIVAGYSGIYDVNSNLLVMKTTSNGTPSWIRNNVQTGIQRANYAEELPGGGYIVTGRVDGGGLSGAAFIKLTAAGADAVTQKALTRSGPVEVEGYSIEQSNLGGFTVAGDYIMYPGAPPTPPDSDVVIAFSDPGMTSFSAYTFSGGGISMEGRMFAKENPDGTYLVCGTSGSTGTHGGLDIFVMKTSSTGTSTWNKNYGGANDEVARAMVLTPDGGVVIAGYTKSAGNGGEDAFLMKLNSAGNPIWIRTYGGSLDDKANALGLTQDGGYVLFGETRSFSQGGTDIYIIKTDSSGRSGCHENLNPTFPAPTAFSFSASGPSAQTYNISTSATSITPRNNTLLKMNICSQCTFPVSINKTDVLCYNGCNGSATVISSGASAPFTYSWSTTPLQTTQTASGLCAGLYSVTVTDANLCSATDTVRIKQPQNALNLSFMADTVNICLGTGDSLKPQFSGGTGPYTFNWSPSTALSCTVCPKPKANPTVSTTYTLTITDANGCTTSAPVFVAVHSPVVNAGPDVTLCTGNALTLNATGSPAMYSWTPSTGLSCTTCANPVANPTILTTYSVTGTDAFGCKKTDAVVVNVVLSPTVTIISPQPATVCAGSPVTLNASSNAAVYSWSPGGQTTPAIVVNPSASAVYTLTVTGINACLSSNTYSVHVNPLPTPNFVTQHITCNGSCNGISTANPASGSSPPYTFQWALSPVQTTQSATGLCAGIYNVYITDAKGCSATGKDTILQPAVLTSTLSTTNAGCICNGTAQAAPSGGTVPYTYQWSGPSFSGTTQQITGLCAGNYSVVISDANGCTKFQNAAITQLPSVVLTVGPSQTICSGTNVTLGAQASGSTGIVYTWNPGSLNGDTIIVAPASNTNYTVTAVNTSSGCADTGYVSVQVVGTPTASISGTDTVCIGTPVTLTGSGTGSYLWNPGGQTNTAITVNPTATGTYTYSLTISNVSSTLTCSDMATFTLTTISSPNASAYATSYSICAGIADDTLIASGGTSYSWTSTPSGNYPANSSIVVSPDVTTTYSVVVSGGTGCNAVTTVTVNVLAGYSNPTVSPNPAAYCLGDSILPFSAPAPPFPASVGWSDLQGNTLWIGNVYSPPQNLTAGSYTILCVQGTGANCLSYPTFVVATIHTQPVISAGNDVSICSGHSAHLLASGGITYAWHPGTYLSDSLVSNPTANPDSTFSYSVTGTDANNCRNVDSVTVYIIANDTCGIHIYNAITPNGDGDNDIWWIDGINMYPDNVVQIYNRWGNVVWQGNNYDNKKVVWKGQNWAGQPLPSGTYFYVVDIKDLGRFSKWVELTR